MTTFALVLLLLVAAGVAKMVYDVQKSKQKRRMKVLAGIEPDPDALTEDCTKTPLFISDNNHS